MSVSPIDDLQRRVLQAQLAGDRHRAMELVTHARTDGSISSHDIRVRVIRAAQKEIGRLWESNEISIAQEHMATGARQPWHVQRASRRELQPARRGD